MTSLRSSRCSHQASVPRVASFHHPLLNLDRVQSVPEPSCHEPLPTSPRTVSRSRVRQQQYRHGPPMEFLTLQRHQMREATYTERSMLGCAASSGFLSLSTRCSARLLPVLFHTGTTQVSVFRGFSSPLASCASRRLLPLLSFPVGSLRSRHCDSRD